MVKLRDAAAQGLILPALTACKDPSCKHPTPHQERHCSYDLFLAAWPDSCTVGAQGPETCLPRGSKGEIRGNKTKSVGNNVT